MKINPIGIQSYQELVRRDNTAPPGVDGSPEAQPAAKKVTIDPQEEIAGSRMAVKAAQGSYAEFLTTEERQALEILFNRFRLNERFGPGYKREASASAENGSLGNLVDVKA